MFDVQIRRKQGDFLLDVSFASSRESGVTALFGVSGSGKSSVVQCVSGLYRPDSGRIVVSGRVLYDSEARIDLPIHQRRIGYIFQDSRLFPHMDVHHNLSYGTPSDRPGTLPFDDVVSLLGIDHLLERRPAALSGGEKQRVAIGRALLSSPGLLLMDEPLASLDEQRKQELLPFLAKLPPLGIPILYVSHSMTEILQLADSLVLLRDGRVAEQGTVEEVAARIDVGVLAGSVLLARVAGHEPEFNLTRLSLGGAEVRVRRLDLPVGASVRLQVDPNEVILARKPPSELSVQNVIPATVSALESHADGVNVRLDVGAPLTARISRRAAEQLALTPGDPIYALVKALSIARGRIARHEG